MKLPWNKNAELDFSGDGTLVVVRLNALGTPKGSRILVGEDQEAEYEVGLNEGLGLYLNGSELPDEVHATQDIKDVVESHPLAQRARVVQIA